MYESVGTGSCYSKLHVRSNWLTSHTVQRNATGHQWRGLFNAHLGPIRKCIWLPCLCLALNWRCKEASKNLSKNIFNNKFEMQPAFRDPLQSHTQPVWKPQRKEKCCFHFRELMPTIYLSKHAPNILNSILPVPWSIKLLELFLFYAKNDQIISHIEDYCLAWCDMFLSFRLPCCLVWYRGIRWLHFNVLIKLQDTGSLKTYSS